MKSCAATLDGAMPAKLSLNIRPKAAAGFAVSLVEEGVTLREAGITAPVLVMGPSQHGGEDEMVMAGMTPVIGSAEDLADPTQPTDVALWVVQRDERLGAHWYESCVRVVP